MMNKLDARIKFLSVLLLTVLIFLVNELIVALCLLLLFIIIRLVFKFPFSGNENAVSRVTRIKNLSMLAAFIILLQLLFASGDNFIIKPLFPDSFPFIGGMGSLKWEGLILGSVVVFRLFTLIIIFSIFSQTTSPYSLAAGLSSLGLNYTVAFVITTTFNLIPFFKEEAILIMDAQKLRGENSMKKGRIFSGLGSYSRLALPLVLGAMRKAQVSSVIMDSRAFGVYKKRTWLDKPQMKLRDFLFIAVCTAFCTVVLFFNFWLK